MQLQFAFMLSADEVLEKVEAVRQAARLRDYELAASLEIDIWQEVLECIAEGGWDVQELSKAALSTTGIKFPRWTA